jgi:quinol monooxygenase YgiN
MNRRLLLTALVPLMAVAMVAHGQDVPLPPETGPAYTVGYLEVVPTAGGAMAAALRDYAKASRKEPGAADVRVLRETGRMNRFLILERWTDAVRQAAHDRGGARRRLETAVAASALAPFDFRSHRDFLGAPLPPSPGPSAVYVMTHLDVAPPAFAPLQKPLRPYFDDARSRAVGFQLLQHMPPRQNHLTALELWRDQSALDAHRASAAARRFRAAADPILGALYDERLYRGLE